MVREGRSGLGTGGVGRREAITGGGVADGATEAGGELLPHTGEGGAVINIANADGATEAGSARSVMLVLMPVLPHTREGDRWIGAINSGLGVVSTVGGGGNTMVGSQSGDREV